MTDRRSDDLSDMWQEGPVARPRPARAPAGRRRRAPQGRRRQNLALAGYAALGLVCLGLAGLTFLLVAAPVDFVRDRLIEQVKAQTGRELAAAGPTSVSFFPLAVSLRDVAVSAPEGMAGGPTLTVPSLDIELCLSSLLSRRPKIERVTLHQPVIEVHVDAEGRRSWDVASAKSGRRRPAPAEAGGPDRQPPGEPPAAKAAALAADLGAQRVRIVGGTLRYTDERSGGRSEVGALDLDLEAVDPSGPLEINGAFDFRGVRLTFAGTATPVSAVLAGQQARLVFNLTGPTLQARYEGRLALEAGLSLDGSVDIRAPSARGLQTWLDQAVPEASDADALTFAARLVAADGRVTLASLEASLGEISVAGSLAVDTRPARALVVGDLKVSALDVGTVLTRPGKRASAPQKDPPAAGAAPSPPPSLQGRANGKGWNEQPLNLAALNLVDADLAIAAGRLIYKEMSTGKAKLVLQVKGGIGEVTLEDIELYGGRGRGVLTLDGTGKVPTVGTSLNLAGVSVQPLLADALGFKWLDGRGDVVIALSGQGLSERQVVDKLSGKVDVVIASGAMVGIDVGRIVRALPQGRLPTFAFKPEERTPFSEFSATFDIANGKAKNHDLKVVSTHLQLAGDGLLDLGPRRIDYTLRAKVSGGEIETGPVLKIGSFEIPIGVEGPWENPAFTVKGQEQLTDMIKHLGKLLKSKEAQEALEGLIGGDRGKRAKQREMLEKFLKKE